MIRTHHLQMEIGEIEPRFVELDPSSRDKITMTLRGLQGLYCDDEARHKLFQKLESCIPDYKKQQTGRESITLWQSTVLAVIRLGCDLDYDTLANLARNHGDLRGIMGVGMFSNIKFARQSIWDAINRISPDLLEEINTIVVDSAHKTLGLTDDLQTRCDSFVVHSNVHFPTDINLLMDAMRKVVTLTAELADELEIGGWRKANYNLEKIRSLYRKTSKLKQSRSQDPKKKEERQDAIIESHKEYINTCLRVLDLADNTLKELPFIPLTAPIAEIRKYIEYGRVLSSQIERRVINGETIPHHEKIFSIFEEYTEWISKGKAGVRQELGLNTCIMSDQHGFILTHHVMQKESDVDVAVPIVRKAANLFKISSVSFDKGFHSPANQETLPEIIEVIVLPAKGYKNAERREQESTPQFKALRRAHSAVESAINALESCGLSRCRDRTEVGFKRYVALGVIGRNLKTLGAKLLERERQQQAA